MAKQSLIYVITNPDFAENCVKIGYTTDLDARLRTFNTAAPQDYEVFATYEVPDISDHKPDQVLHSLLLKLDPTLKINPKKEFFYLYPEDVYEILEYIAIIHDRTEKLHLYGTIKKRTKPVSVEPKKAKTLSGNLYMAGNAKLLSVGDGTYVLLKGSELHPWNGADKNKRYKKHQDDLIANGGASEVDGKIITQVDLSFNSPSTPADVVFCNARNGWVTWKNSEGKTLDEVERHS